MLDKSKADREAALMMRAIFWSAVMAAAAGVGLLLTPVHAFNPSKSGIDPFTIHCVLNSAAYFGVWFVYRSPASRERHGFLAANLALVAMGLGIVSSILAGTAAFSFSMANAKLLLLAFPGIVGWFIGSIDDFFKEPVPDDIQDEAALIEPDEGNVSLRNAAVTNGFTALFYFVYMLIYMIGFGVGTLWYYIVWYSVNDGESYRPWRIVGILGDLIVSNGRLYLTLAAFLTALILVLGLGGFVWARLKRWWPSQKVNAEQQDVVDARLRALWDYANRPERKEKGWPIWGLGTLIFGAATAAGFVLLLYNDPFALWVLHGHHEAMPAWYVFSASVGSFFFGFLGLELWAWSLWLFIMNRWPGVPDALATAGLQRSNPQGSSDVGAIRWMLKKRVRRGDTAPFDARDFLMKRWRGFTRGVYIFTAIATPVALWGTWASINSYTLISPAGIEDADAFFGKTVIYPYSDVKSVEIGCTLNGKGETQFLWQVTFANGSALELFREGDIDHDLPVLLQVDRILRGYGADFILRDPDTKRSTVEPECLEKLSADVADRDGFLRFMHQK